jgi:hypothetical protein
VNRHWKNEKRVKANDQNENFLLFGRTVRYGFIVQS